MNNFKRITTLACAAALVGVFSASASAQLPEHLRDYQLSQRSATGEGIAPFFNGWIANDDGSTTYVFGFANLNREEIVDVPLGPNNFIEPAEYDGVQPTHFPVYSRGGFRGIQERGAFGVTVPADKAGEEVVWTVKHAGRSYSIPGRTTSTAYEMSHAERALGSLKPAIRFEEGGEVSMDRVGIYADKITAKVGQPVTLTAYAKDRGVRENYEDVDQLEFPLGTEWIMHQGPVGAQPDFEPAAISGRDREENGDEGKTVDGWTVVQSQATFWEPGEYVVRLRVDNFSAPDSGFDYVCCWSNAYVPVTVTQ